MPQPLSSFIKDGNWSIRLDPECVQEEPDLAVLITRAIASWSAIEHKLATFLIKFLGAENAPGFAMYSALTSTTAQFAAINAAARETLDSSKLEMFEAAFSVARVMHNERNKLAHWIWGRSDQAPSALILANPDAVFQQQISLQQYKSLSHSALSGMSYDLMTEYFKYDFDRIYVYSQPDLERINRDLSETQRLLGLVEWIFNPLPFGPSPDELFRQLSNLRLYREAIDRIRGRRQNTPQAPP